MFIQILIGAMIGAVLGVLQMLVLRKVTEGLTGRSETNPVIMGLAAVQFLVVIAVLVLLAFYAVPALLAAGVAMLVSGFVTWAIIYKRQARKGS